MEQFVQDLLVLIFDGEELLEDPDEVFPDDFTR